QRPHRFLPAHAANLSLFAPTSEITCLDDDGNLQRQQISIATGGYHPVTSDDPRELIGLATTTACDASLIRTSRVPITPGSPGRHQRVQ
ncbi:MAG: hypothetical protein ACK523_05155, partial [Pirellulaceae bacterium]